MNDFAYINDSIHGLILLSKHEKMFISSIGFNRLHDVYQDSTVYLTYPTNRTKRFEHSIGTMKLCSDMFYHSILNTDNKILESFFSDFKSSLEKLDIDLSGDFIHSKFEYDLIPFNLKELGLKYAENIYILLIKSVRLAGLLHDIGHTPFSHVVENSLENIYEKLSNDEKENESENEKVKSFIEIMSKYSYEDKKLHENIGDYITSKIFDELITPEDKELEIIKKIVLEIFKNNEIFKCLHRIVDSSIDADRLDYVTRDSISSGIDSGKIDYKRIIDGMKINKHDKDFYVFSFQEKSLNSIEDFFRRRLDLYKNVIYHHRVIKTDFILKNVVKELIICYFSGYLVSDNEDLSISNLWEFLDSDIEIISQWNDSYIITVLRNIFFMFKNKKEYNNIYYELFEIFMGNKYSFSLIKRREHFKILDDSIKEELFNFYNSDYKKIENKENTEDYKMTLDIYYNIFSGNVFFGNVSNFIFNYMYSKKDFLCLNMSKLKDEIVKCIEKYLKSLNMNIVEIIIDFKTLTSGLNDEQVCFYKNDGKICNINDISNIKYILEKDLEYFPMIYVYVFYESNEIRELLYEHRDGILKYIGKNIAKYIINNYNKFIDEKI